jgi:hypothetical protein
MLSVSRAGLCPVGALAGVWLAGLHGYPRLSGYAPGALTLRKSLLPSSTRTTSRVT